VHRGRSLTRASFLFAALAALLWACSSTSDGGNAALDAGTPDGGANDAAGNAVPDPDVRLAALSLSRGVLSPSFAATTVAYTATVPAFRPLTRPWWSRLSGDTLVIGADHENGSKATGGGGDQADTSLPNAGAAYVFERANGAWTQQAYVKATNTRASAYYGIVVAISDTLAVGSNLGSSNATGIGGNQSDTSAPLAGAAYLVRWR
jgi:hypothetical protein